MAFTKRALVYGGKGALGATCVEAFKSKNWWVCSIDLFPNEEAHSNVTIEITDSWTTQEQQVSSKVEEALGSDKVDAIICVAGGWAGGNAASKALVKNADLMWKQSVWTSTIAAHLAAKHLNENGLLVLTGAHPAQRGTAGMMGYGMAKAAVHQLTKSLAGANSGMPNGAVTTAILPVTLDTPMNRKNMPDADYSSWTPLTDLAMRLCNWAGGAERPASGSLMQVFTKEGVTEYVPVTQA